MTDKLKPCPHCEQIPKRHIFEDGSGFITCKCDKLTGGTTIFANWRRPDGKITKRRKEVSAFSEHEADIIWNSRPIEDALKARIAELEQELKNQVELHNEWLGTYRIKLDYIEELERKIERLTT